MVELTLLLSRFNPENQTCHNPVLIPNNGTHPFQSIEGNHGPLLVSNMTTITYNPVCCSDKGEGGNEVIIGVIAVVVFVSLATLANLVFGSRWVTTVLGVMGIGSGILILSRVIQWRVFQGHLLPYLLCYDEHLWTALSCISLLAFVLLILPYHKFRKVLHYYYRIRLRRAFYKKDVHLSFLTKKRFGRCYPYFISSVVVNDYNMPLSSLPRDTEDPDPPHLKPYSLFSLAPKFCGSARTGYVKSSLVSPFRFFCFCLLLLGAYLILFLHSLG
ncbi:MAG: hypothetical protein KIY12_04245 [Thermoplasmata archaeon]|uniref:Uncharacterized protein n=1 Tax=Candidatus Sysuiplasma superficiale TaxID=2823368 RepID=A0A8J7YNA6_9ARCH|nr:hypothetical protein [Candidatus Sysuiplasma superficiale]